MFVIVKNGKVVSTSPKGGIVGGIRYRLGGMSKSFYMSLKDRGFKELEVEGPLKGLKGCMFSVKNTATGASELASGHLGDNIGARLGELL